MAGMIFRATPPGSGAAALQPVFALARTTPTKVTSTITLNPLTASVVATFLVDEPIGLHLLIGIAAVFIGILIASTNRSAAPRADAGVALPAGSAAGRPGTRG